jgi:hypothetical protein
VSENRVVKRLFGLKRDEMTGGWRTLHFEELRDLYSTPGIIGMIMSRRMVERGIYYKWGEEKLMYDTSETSRRKEQLGRPARKWKDNNKMDLRCD